MTSANSAWVRKPRIFVVDDQRIIADTLAMILEQNGYSASAMYSATDALDRVCDETPDLLISDVILDPDSINGIDLAVYFERQCPTCKVLLISGNAMTSSLQSAARQRGHNFPLLQKPIAPQKLLEIVYDMLRHLRQGELRPAS